MFWNFVKISGVVSELLYTQKLQTGKLIQTTKKAAQLAAKKLIALGMHNIPVAAKEDLEQEANTMVDLNNAE